MSLDVFEMLNSGGLGVSLQLGSSTSRSWLEPNLTSAWLPSPTAREGRFGGPFFRTLAAQTLERGI